MKIAQDTVVFSDGSSAYANFGIVGLGTDGTIHHGCDGDMYTDYMEPEYRGLTKSQRIELAEYMIEAWRKVKEVAENE